MLPINLTEDILKVLSKNHSTFIAKELGSEFLSTEMKTLLTNFGVDFKNLYSIDTDTIRNAYEFGQVAVYAKETDLKELNYAQFKEYIKSKKTIPLTLRDESIIKGCKQQVETSLRALQNRMSNEINQVILNKYQELYQNESISDINNISLTKDDIKKIVGEIAKKTKKWESEFDRILQYNSTDAFEKGKQEVILKLDGKETLVYKIPHQEACKYCHKLFVSYSGQPKIYTLEQLISNGTNIGRKPQDWKATIGPIHPHCRCTLKQVPEGMKYNPKTGKFDLKDSTFKSSKKKKRDKIQFTFAGVEYTV